MNYLILKVRNYLKYFNLVIGILMITVFSLNLEILFHNKRDQYQNMQKTDLLNNQCEICNQESFNTMMRFTVEGALLAAFLAFFSFLLALKIDMFEQNYKWFIPACLIESFSTALYFVFTSIEKLPDSCRDLRQKCDCDFQYIFEHKLIPMSVIMLLTTPQFIFRSIYILVVKCSNRNKLTSIKRRSFRRKIYPVDLKPINESITELDNTSYREMPIDCPAVLSNEIKTDIDQRAEDYNIQRSIINPISRRFFNRNSSLSTIAEEKTMSSCTTTLTTPDSSIQLNNSHKQLVQQNPNALVIGFLTDLKQHFSLMNDINECFSVHRTKDGEFSRNIAIRFKSHENENNISSGSSSGYNTSPNKSNLGLDDSKLLSVTTDANNNTSLKLNEEKLRFVKHLKNRLETKRGKPFCNLSTLSSRTSLSSIINSPSCKVKKRNSYFSRQKNFSRRTVDFDKFRLAIDNFIGDNQQQQQQRQSFRNKNQSSVLSRDSIYRMSNISNFIAELDTNRSYLDGSKIVVKTDVEPAYF